MSNGLSDQFVDRYLRLLHLMQRPEGISGLQAVVAAHLTTVPFENISKLYRRNRFGLTGLPDIEMYLNGIEQCHFGGTCYANNYYLYRLLASLGYEVKLCGADMTNPDVHMVMMVRVEGREYLVDVGYGAPLFEPIPRDLSSDYEVALGRERFVLKPQDGEGCSRLDMYRNGTLRHGYTAKPAAREVGYFDEIIAASLRPDATFMNAVVLVRHWRGRSVVIRNMTVTENLGTQSNTRALADKDQLVREIESKFEIPSAAVREAIAGIGELRDVWD